MEHAWVGLYEMTPDRHPIIGEAPGVAGFYLANGFSGHGFQHAPVVGKLIAELIVQGAATTLTSRASASTGSNAAISPARATSSECRERDSNPQGPEPTSV